MKRKLQTDYLYRMNHTGRDLSAAHAPSCLPAKMAATRLARLLRHVQNNVGVRFVQRQNGSTKRYVCSLMVAATGGGMYYAYSLWMRNKQLQILPVVHARNQQEVGSLLLRVAFRFHQLFFMNLHPSYRTSVIWAVTHSSQRVHVKERGFSMRVVATLHSPEAVFTYLVKGTQSCIILLYVTLSDLLAQSRFMLS